MTSSLRILFVGTKPAFPPIDGGRLLMWNTIVQLANRGHRITFVAPDLNLGNRKGKDHLSQYCTAVHLISARAGLFTPSLISAVLTGRPLSIVRHSHSAVRNFVAEAVVRETFDVIHAEQVHAMVNLPSSGALPPVILRAQNVESQLWRMVARIKPRVAWIARRDLGGVCELWIQCHLSPVGDHSEFCLLAIVERVGDERRPALLHRDARCYRARRIEDRVDDAGHARFGDPVQTREDG